ncbi:MAG: manganese efflux pump, partial [Oscillospiraceae bacterium]|nr:manganese efflux pump [Oscillospiraceae bacterium]
MGFFELLILAVGLSMDAFAVSVCKGLSMKKAGFRQCAVCGGWFGGFQALMPLVGFYLGTLFADAIEAFDHWVAFALLAVIGINMLKEAFSP